MGSLWGQSDNLKASRAALVQPVLTERDRSALEGFCKQYDAEFPAIADPEKLEPWLSYRFDRLVQARTDRSRQWDKAHQPEKVRARQEIARLHSKLATPKGVVENVTVILSQPDIGN